MTEDLSAVYDEMGAAFERHAADSAYNAHYDRPAVLDALGPVDGARVLDAACGPGLYLQALLERGARVSAFDASAAMVSLARQRVASMREEHRARAVIEQGRLEGPLPYEDGSFDLAVCALAIHYLRDRAAAFGELYRVLRPGGSAVISTQHPTIDWLRKGGSYFDSVLETDVWELADGPRTVRFWREPLSALCDGATDAGFLISRVIEPRPAKSMRAVDPDEYDELQRRPGFLILKLLKPIQSS
jgi:SAM-dependent methyltransferase